MPWFPVDDRFHSHPKAAAASLAALGLWTLAGSWANDHLTDGNVPEHMIPLLSRGATGLADELVTVGLWRRTKAGYRFHQWHERNATRSEVTAAREKKSSGGALGNHRRWHAKIGKVDPNCAYCGPAPSANGVPIGHRYTDRKSESVSDAPANPPIPSHPLPEVGSSSRVTNDRAPASPRPEPTCPEHRDDPDPPACRRCKAAREAVEAWDAAYATANAMTQAHQRDNRPQCERHRGQLAHNCAMCRSERLAAND